MPSPYPLTPANRLRLARAFAPVPLIDLSVDCVVEGQMGAAFVDDLAAPSVYRVEQNGMFTVFAGDAQSHAARTMVASLPPQRMVMPSAPGWFDLLREVWGARLLPLERYSVASDDLSLDHVRGLLAASPHGAAVERIGPAHARFFADGPYEHSAFESYEDFLERSLGVILLRGGEVAGAAYGALACSRGIEISIYVEPPHRERGVGTALGAALVAACLEAGLEPHWDAANPESVRLATRLGYTRPQPYEALFLTSPSQ